MSECKGSVSPKLDKACIDGDSEELSEEQTSNLLYLSNERTDIQSTVRLFVYEVEKSDSVGDETVEKTSEIRQGHRGHVNSVRGA